MALYFSLLSRQLHQYEVLCFRSKVSLKMRPVFVILALCVAGAYSDEASDAWNSRQRRVKAETAPGVKKPEKLSGRIVGGTAVHDPIPYLLSLRDGGNHICGASIIAPRHALSAAHCQQPPSDVDRLTVLGGTIERTNDASGIVLQVDKYVSHKRFNPRTFANDIAILRVTTSFLDHPRLAVIPLAPTTYKLKVNSFVSVSGWGLTGAEQDLAPTLLTVQIPVMGMAKCVAQWSPVPIARTAICAGQVGRDSCNGDSGGPLVQDDVLVGLVSWGADDCGSAYPGIYTYVANKAMAAFIEKTIEETQP
uniref:Peptidase S1 domain-containing protein n=1 Tax=Anopheles farauti TaxID=69004 RepID=A0A182QWI3_9DIPT